MLDFCIYSYLINCFFNFFFPPAQNDFIAHEAEEQVWIGRPGTRWTVHQQLDRERPFRQGEALQKDQTPKPVKRKTKTTQRLASQSKKKKVMVSPYMICISIHDLNEFCIYHIKNTCTSMHISNIFWIDIRISLNKIQIKKRTKSQTFFPGRWWWQKLPSRVIRGWINWWRRQYWRWHPKTDHCSANSRYKWSGQSAESETWLRGGNAIAGNCYALRFKT